MRWLSDRGRCCRYSASVLAGGEDRYGKLLPNIRGIRLSLTDVRAKLKFGTNRTVQHREVVAQRLQERGGPLDLEARSHVLDRIERAKR